MQPNTSAVSLLQEQLHAARTRVAHQKAQNAQGSIIHVPDTGKTITAAYEQFRNAAEYTEEHLLLQRAIRRFFKRSISFHLQRHIGNIGEELIVELTQAGYLQNSSLSVETGRRVRELAEYYVQAFWRMREMGVSREHATEWTLDILSVETEQTINPHEYQSAFAYFAYNHYLQLFPRQILANTHEENEAYEICLYIAVHQALLKSDISIVRHDLMRMYHQTPEDMANFIAFNENVNGWYTSNFTQKINRAVSKYGAPLRILKSLVESRDDVPELLADRHAFMNAYGAQISKDYRLVGKRLNKGLIKSIIFIFITKVCIGVGIEVPYDLMTAGAVAFMPLIINLLFPPLYMTSLKLGLKLPSLTNADALKQYVDNVFYGDTLMPQSSLHLVPKTPSSFAQFMYGALFLVPLAIMAFVLHLLHFNIIQAIIFFVFLSTASFFGFRLSRMVRELELITKQQGLITTLGDFFYLPFILMGRWLSSKYAKINAVALVLDMLIELPLKNILRLVRQWMRFLNEKREEIY